MLPVDGVRGRVHRLLIRIRGYGRGGGGSSESEARCRKRAGEEPPAIFWRAKKSGSNLEGQVTMLHPIMNRLLGCHGTIGRFQRISWWDATNGMALATRTDIEDTKMTLNSVGRKIVEMPRPQGYRVTERASPE